MSSSELYDHDAGDKILFVKCHSISKISVSEYIVFSMRVRSGEIILH